jgi:hypothetical protein
MPMDLVEALTAGRNSGLGIGELILRAQQLAASQDEAASLDRYRTGSLDYQNRALGSEEKRAGERLSLDAELGRGNLDIDKIRNAIYGRQVAQGDRVQSRADMLLQILGGGAAPPGYEGLGAVVGQMPAGDRGRLAYGFAPQPQPTGSEGLEQMIFEELQRNPSAGLSPGIETVLKILERMQPSYSRGGLDLQDLFPQGAATSPAAPPTGMGGAGAGTPEDLAAGFRQDLATIGQRAAALSPEDRAAVRDALGQQIMGIMKTNPELGRQLLLEADRAVPLGPTPTPGTNAAPTPAAPTPGPAGPPGAAVPAPGPSLAARPEATRTAPPARQPMRPQLPSELRPGFTGSPGARTEGRAPAPSAQGFDLSALLRQRLMQTLGGGGIA